MSKPLNIQGKRFGKLTAIRWTGNRNKDGKYLWLCKCDCGNERIVPASFLVANQVMSCKSCRKTTIIETNHKRKGTRLKTPKERLYRIWRNMNYRCISPHAVNYKYYGGKGVSVCEEWRHNYKAFQEWALLNGYNDSLQIDRIDFNGNYSPQNCRWVTISEQSINKESNIWIIFRGKQISLAKVLNKFCIDRKQVYEYLRTLIE